MKTSIQLPLKAIAIAFLTLVLISASLVLAEKPDHTEAKVTSTVIQVYDGDTIKLANGMEVRYLGLDTPETHHPEKPVEYFGVKASEFNKQLVGSKKVKLEYDVQKETSMTATWLTCT